MKKKIMTTAITALMLISLISVFQAGTANAQGEVPDRETAITKTADRLVALQSDTDYGWDYVVTDLSAHTGNPSAYNLYGVTALGLIDACVVTGESSYLTAAGLLADDMIVGDANTGGFFQGTNFETGKDKWHVAQDYQFLMRYAEVSGNTDYSDYAKAAWEWQKANLHNGRYASGEAWYNWAVSITDVGAVIWQGSAYGLAAQTMEDTDWAGGMASIVNEHFDEIVGDDPMAWANAALFLNAVDPITYATSIDTLILNLKATQGEDGSWNTGWSLLQDTVYAVRALSVLNEAEAAQKGAAWLVANQLGNGGWLEDDGNEYSETNSEAIQALVATEAPVTIDTKGYYSIQSAIDSASEGDIIKVAAGIYDEQVEITQSLTLQGAGDTTVIQPSGAAILTTVKTTPWLGTGTYPMAAIVFVDTAAEVVVRDLKIDGSLITEVPAGAVWVTGLAYLETSGTVESVAVQGYPQLGTRSCGIWTSAISSVSTVEVKYCNAVGYNRGSIYACGGTLTVNFNHNEVYGPGEIVTQVPNGMFFLRGATGSATYNKITDLAYTGETYRSTGIGTYRPGTDLIFGHNEIYNVQNAFAIAGGSYATIENNYIYDCHTGVKLEAIGGDRASNVIIQYNDIMNNDFAIRCGGDMGDGNEAHYNNFVGNEGSEWIWSGETYIGAVSNVHQTYTLDATLNWWGDPSGPRNPTTNPSATGDDVSNNVNYTPWLDAPYLTGVARSWNVQNVDTEEDFNSIQAAVDAADNGETVLVYPGMYNETLNLRGKALTIEGSGVGTTIVNASSFMGYAIQNFGSSSTIRNLTLIGTQNSYGFKVSHVSDIILENIKVENSSRTGIDLNTVNGATLSNIEVINTAAGFGIMILDSNNITVTNIATSNNAWGGVSVQTKGRASDSITFSGNFDAQEDNPLLLEKDPPAYYDITNVAIPSKFGYVVYAFRGGDNYKQWFYQETLDDAKAFAGALMAGSFTYSDMTIYDIAEENYYVIEGMSIQAAIDAASSGDTVLVGPGTYEEGVVIDKPLTLRGENRETTEIKFGYGDYPSSSPLTISADGVTVSGFTIRSGPYIEPAWTIVVKGNSALLTDLHVVKEPLLTYNDNPRIGGAAIFVGTKPDPTYAGGIDGFTFTDSVVDSAWNGIYAPRGLGSSNIVVRNVDFTYPGEWAILLMMSTNSTIEGNTFTCTADQYGVTVTRGSDNIEIVNNQFVGSGSQEDSHVGILLQAYAEGTMGDVDILGNDISGFNIGILVQDVVVSGISINYNNIVGNVMGLKHTSTYTVDATLNWWGDPSGPSGVGPGTGDNVSDNVDYTPWFATENPSEDVKNVEVIRAGETIAWSETIQAAVDAASPGDTVLVYPGTYVGDIRINKSLTVRSTDGAEETIIDGTGSYIVIISHSDVTFDGFTVTNPEYAGGADASGILVETVTESVSNVRILNNIVTQVRSETGTPSMYGATGINIGNAPLSDIVISGNTIENIHNPEGASSDHTCGINVWDGAENVVISNNTISDIKYNGIILEHASNVQIENNAITECKVGIRVEPYDGATVSDLTIHYNNIAGNEEYGVLNTTTDKIDATYNWWGHPRGPRRGGSGRGDRVSKKVLYRPWLTKPFQTVLEEHIGHYGSEGPCLEKGWNTFSVPIYLDNNAWEGIAAYLDENIAYRFNASTQAWELITTGSELDPLDAIYIRMNSEDSVPLVVSVSITNPPVKELKRGWNLVGLAVWEEENMSVDQALVSVELTPDGNRGYTIVVNPSLNREPWTVYTIGQPGEKPLMNKNKAYWVYMENPGNLAGFSSTPLPFWEPE